MATAANNFDGRVYSSQYVDGNRQWGGQQRHYLSDSMVIFKEVKKVRAT